MGQHYTHIYGVVIFSGHWKKRSSRTLIMHLKFLYNYRYLQDPTKKILVVCIQQGEDISVYKKISRLLKIAPKRENISFAHIVNINWGMTVGALWNMYSYCKANHITTDYMSVCDDDWLFNQWASREKLIRDNNWIYCGVFTVVSPYADDLYRNAWNTGHKEYDNDPQDEGIAKLLLELHADKRRWTDGATYFFDFKKLNELEERIGCFSKAPKDKPFDYGDHGIRYGEVGFPTEVWSAGFRFGILKDHYYCCGTSVTPTTIICCGNIGSDSYFVKDEKAPIPKDSFEIPFLI